MDASVMERTRGVANPIQRIVQVAIHVKKLGAPHGDVLRKACLGGDRENVSGRGQDARAGGQAGEHQGKFVGKMPPASDLFGSCAADSTNVVRKERIDVAVRVSDA